MRPDEELRLSRPLAERPSRPLAMRLLVRPDVLPELCVPAPAPPLTKGMGSSPFSNFLNTSGATNTAMNTTRNIANSFAQL